MAPGSIESGYYISWLQLLLLLHALYHHMPCVCHYHQTCKAMKASPEPSGLWQQSSLTTGDRRMNWWIPFQNWWYNPCYGCTFSSCPRHSLVSRLSLPCGWIWTLHNLDCGHMTAHLGEAPLSQFWTPSSQCIVSVQLVWKMVQSYNRQFHQLPVIQKWSQHCRPADSTVLQSNISGASHHVYTFFSAGHLSHSVSMNVLSGWLIVPWHCWLDILTWNSWSQKCCQCLLFQNCCWDGTSRTNNGSLLD